MNLVTKRKKKKKYFSTFVRTLEFVQFSREKKSPRLSTRCTDGSKLSLKGTNSEFAQRTKSKWKQKLRASKRNQVDRRRIFFFSYKVIFKQLSIYHTVYPLYLVEAEVSRLFRCRLQDCPTRVQPTLDDTQSERNLSRETARESTRHDRIHGAVDLIKLVGRDRSAAPKRKID